MIDYLFCLDRVKVKFHNTKSYDISRVHRKIQFMSLLMIAIDYH